jgi:hypothetical protein
MTPRAKEHGNHVDVRGGHATLIEHSSANLAGELRKRAGSCEQQTQASDRLSHDVESSKIGSSGRITADTSLTGWGLPPEPNRAGEETS